MRPMPLSRLMSSPVITVPPDLPVGAALDVMCRCRFSCLVVGEGDQAAGIVTERDVVKAYGRIHDHPELTVAEVMTPSPLAVPASMDHYDAFMLMKARRFRHLLVTDETGSVVGIVTESDFVRHLGVDFYVRPKDVLSVMAPVICVDHATPLAAVAKRLALPGVYCVVVEREGQAVGILTERDIVRLLRPGSEVADDIAVGTVMGTPLITLPQEASLMDASDLLRRHAIRHLVVVGGSGEARGMVSEHELVQGLESDYVLHLEQVLADREAALADLAASHEELREFARIASHDLQEPTRTLVSFSQLLRKTYGDRLDEEAHALLGFIVEGARRMNKQVRDLAAYTQAATPAGKDDVCDATAVARAVVSHLHETLAAADATVEIGDLPRLRLSRGNLQVLFAELLTNALRFVRPGTSPVIRLGAEPDGAFWRLWVADNGIGIDPVYFGDVFRLFTRLHPAASPDGTGAGLAICRRIVASAGGRIWVESEPGQGCRILFTLPVVTP